jgi:hypothetical protein
MNLPDLPKHPKLESVHPTPWMQALIDPSTAPAVSVPPLTADGGWRTWIAVRQEQVVAAQDLVRRRYAWRGYRVSAAAGSGPQGGGEAAPRITLLAENKGQLVGTLTVRPDSPQGLLAEETYGDEIACMRRDGRRLGELVKLAVEEGADWKQALDSLVQSAYLVTRIVHALTDVVIEVNPRHVRFYKRVFGFVVAAAERVCERAGAPAVLLRLDLEQFGTRLQLAA